MGGLLFSSDGEDEDEANAEGFSEVPVITRSDGFDDGQ